MLLQIRSGVSEQGTLCGFPNYYDSNQTVHRRVYNIESARKRHKAMPCYALASGVTGKETAYDDAFVL